MKGPVVALFLVAQLLSAQPPLQWQRCLGGSATEDLRRVRVMPAGGYAAVGWTSSVDGDVVGQHGDRDLWVVRLDETGQLMWQRTLGGSGRDMGFDLLPLPDGDMIVVGQTASNDGDVLVQQGVEDVWLLRLDASGAVVWARTYGGTLEDNGHAVIAGGNGELIIAGRTRSNDGDVSGNHGDWDFLLLRTDSAGQLLGQWCYGGADAERSNTIKRAATERFIMGGYASSNDGDVSSTNGDLDVWVIEVDDTGSIQWEQSWGGTSMESTEGIDIAADGGIVVPAWSLSGDLDNTCQLGTGDWWLSKLDAAGTLSWRSCVGGTAEEIPYDVVALPDTGFVVAGQTFSADGDVQSHIAWQDAWLVRFDATGNIAWERCVGGSMMEEFHGLEATPDGGYIACGNTSSNDVDVSGNHGGYDGWVAKFGPDALGIARPAVSPASVRFDTWSGLLSIVLPEAERRVGVKLLDAHGRVVSATAFSGREHQLDPGDRASGVYLVRLERSGQVEHHRVLRL